MRMRYFLAIDIGASSGRHIVGWKEKGVVQTREVYRFPNGVRSENGHLLWDMETLLSEVKEGIEIALETCGSIESLAIDTWGVDYVRMQGDQAMLPVYAYRDSRTESVIDAVHQRISFSRLYQKTGCQFQPFNSIYQWYADQREGNLEKITDILMIPEYLLYRLCGKKVREYTNATTTGMVNAKTGEFDEDIIAALGLPGHLFPKLAKPGTVVGEYRGISCMLCATHDTASAVEGIFMEENAPYISSGTWSLLGVKIPNAKTDAKSQADNFSNEGGVGYYRYQKNIMGMWPVNELRRELCPDTPFDEIVKMAQESFCQVDIDVNGEAFLAPESMKAAFDEAAGGRLKTAGDYFRCAYLSLARSYGEALTQLEENTGQTYDCLYIVGGGAKNDFLNRLTEAATGKRIIALPMEATVMGNLKLQMEVKGDEL